MSFGWQRGYSCYQLLCVVTFSLGLGMESGGGFNKSGGFNKRETHGGRGTFV